MKNIFAPLKHQDILNRQDEEEPKHLFLCFKSNHFTLLLHKDEIRNLPKINTQDPICKNHPQEPSADTIRKDHLQNLSSDTIRKDHPQDPSAGTIRKNHLQEPSTKSKEDPPHILKNNKVADENDQKENLQILGSKDD